MKQVAIIGMGVGGVAVLMALAKKYNFQKPADIQIDCYDQAETFGRGIPFSERSPEALINSKVKKISYDYENLEDFHQWLKENHPAKSMADYVPRFVYGDYTYERTMDLIEKLKARPIYRKINQLNYQEQSKQWSVDGNLYDEVHLCIGNQSYQDPYKLIGESHYIHRPYPLEKVDRALKNANSVAIIGTSLTAIDCIKQVLNFSQVDTVYVFSRSNKFPAVRGDDSQPLEYTYLTFELVYQAKANNYGKFTFASLLDLFEKEVKEQKINYRHFQENLLVPGKDGIQHGLNHPRIFGVMPMLMNRVTEIMTVGWEAMPESDRREFNQYFKQLIELTRNPMPDKSARELLDFIDQGRLVILDEVDGIQPSESQFKILNKEKEVIKVVDWVINATGLDMSFESGKDLSHRLINDRYAQVDSAGGLSIVRPATLISPRYGTWENLFAHGLIVQGPIHQNNATIKIQQHADMLIRHTEEIRALDV